MTRADALAQQLLDAQVEFLLGEVSGERLAENVAQTVDDLLQLAQTVTLEQLADREQVKATLHTLVSTNGEGPLIDELINSLAEGAYTLAANDEHRIGEVIDREHVERLVSMALGMHDLRDRVLERLAESPLVADVASAFVSRIIAEFFRSNRQRAERVPGVSSLLAMGDRAADKVRGTSDRQFTDVLGDVAGRSAQFALRRLSNAIKGTMNDAPLFGAAMEVWDIYAAEHVGELRNYLTQQNVHDLAVFGNEAWLTIRETEYFHALLDGAVDVYFNALGHYPIATVLTELGLDREVLITEVMRHTPRAVELLKENGVLADLIRERLAPFFQSEAVLELLAAVTESRPDETT